MQFTASPTDLKAVVSAVASVVREKNAMPVLDNILLTPSGDTAVTLTGSDGDVDVTATLTIEGAQNLYSVLIPGKDLLDAVKHLGDFPVDIEIDDKTFEMRITDFLGDICFMCSNKVEEYPTRKALADDGVTIPMTAEALASTVLASSYADKTKESIRPIMKGVAYDLRPDGLRIVATDSKRLFAQTIPTIALDEPRVLLISAPLLAAISSTIRPAADTEMSLSFDNKNIRLTAGNITVIGAAIEGKYPRWEGVMPRNNDKVAVIDTKTLLAAIDRVASAASPSTNLIRLDFDGESKLTVSARDIDFSKSRTVTIPTVSQTNFPSGTATSANGQPCALSIGVRANFLVANVKSFQNKEVSILLSDAARAILVKDSACGLRTTLVMPMQLEYA